jgi:predicted MFS family arabinose efflux permease
LCVFKGDNKEDYGKQRLWGAFGWGLGAFVIGACISTIQELNNCNNPLNVDYMPCFYSFAVLMGIAILIGFLFEFDDTKHEDQSFLKGLSSIACDCRYIYFILTMLFCGCATGIIQTFLFWHLQDIGGTQFLFSTIIALQCISGIFMYCLSGSMILCFGHHRVLYAGLVGYALRCFGYAFITNSWLVLPLELLHGLTNAAVWSAGVVYVGLIPGASVTMQGILGGVYFGLGCGGGAIVGGLIVSLVGCPYTFLILGIISILDLLLFVLVNNCSAMHCKATLHAEDSSNSEELNSEYTLLKEEPHAE